MRIMSKTVATVVAVLLSLAVPLSATASPGIVVVPDEHHFGDVELKTSVTVDVTVTSDWLGVLYINSITMVNGSSPDFTFELPPNYDGTIPPFGELVIKVTYTPSAPGFAAAVLAVEWTNGHEGTNYVELDGTGIDPGGPVDIDSILEFFYQGIDDGDIDGVGRNCSSRRAHLKVFEFKLLMVKFFIMKGWDRGACTLLWHAHDRSDGQKPPKDWIEEGPNGNDVPELSYMILQLLSDMGCL